MYHFVYVPPGLGKQKEKSKRGGGYMFSTLQRGQFISNKNSM